MNVHLLYTLLKRWTKEKPELYAVMYCVDFLIQISFHLLHE